MLLNEEFMGTNDYLSLGNSAYSIRELECTAYNVQ